MTEAEITYEALMNKWRKELRSTTLTRIDPNFYHALDEHLRQLAADYDREHDVNPNGARAMILQDELRNLQRARDDIYDLRERKIAIASIIAARGGNPDKSMLTKGELELYEELVRVLKGARRDLLKRSEREENPVEKKAREEPPKPEAPTRAPGGPPAPPDPASPGFNPEAAALPSAVGASNAASAPVERPLTRGVLRGGRVLVRVREAVEPFTASDLRTYHLSPSDLVSLPKAAASALVQRGKAEIVSD